MTSHHFQCKYDHLFAECILIGTVCNDNIFLFRHGKNVWRHKATDSSSEKLYCAKIDWGCKKYCSRNGNITTRNMHIRVED